jgi:hypothetical protein
MKSGVVIQEPLCGLQGDDNGFLICLSSFGQKNPYGLLSLCICWRLVVVTLVNLWSSGRSPWLHTQRSRVRFQTLPDFL